MQQSPVGNNHGWRSPELGGPDSEMDTHSTDRRPRRSLSPQDHEAEVDVFDIHPGDLYYFGMVAHRGILHEDEFVDLGAVVAAVEDRLGYSLKYVNEVYGPGRPDPGRVAQRAMLDEEFLKIQDEGGNMALLASVMGWHVLPHGECRKMAKALKRAREHRNE